MVYSDDPLPARLNNQQKTQMAQPWPTPQQMPMGEQMKCRHYRGFSTGNK
jgi:hypothetical protein